MEVPVLCAICKHPVDRGAPSSILTEKGSSNINQASITRKDRIHTVPGDKIHRECHRKYCNPHQIAKDTNQNESKPSTSRDRPILRRSFPSRPIASFVADQSNLGGRESIILFKLKLLD